MLRSCLSLAFVALALPVIARSQDLPILQKARAYYGSEADLAAIQSVHFKGQLVSTETTVEGAERTLEAEVEIIVQHPYQQRIVARAAGRTEITGLDDYEAWHRVEDPANPSGWRLSLLGADQIKRLRANTWESLAFYRGIEHKGGHIEDRGMVDLNGVRAHKVSFVHDHHIIFHRYFDPATGRLLLTETDQGARIREEGEIRVAGVRFPKQIITTTEGRDGGFRRVVLTFNSVQVNQPHPHNLFRVPFMGPRLAQ